MLQKNVMNFLKDIIIKIINNKKDENKKRNNTVSH